MPPIDMSRTETDSGGISEIWFESDVSTVTSVPELSRIRASSYQRGFEPISGNAAYFDTTSIETGCRPLFMFALPDCRFAMSLKFNATSVAHQCTRVSVTSRTRMKLYSAANFYIMYTSRYGLDKSPFKSNSKTPQLWYNSPQSNGNDMQ